jgi:hypothetical protein
MNNDQTKVSLKDAASKEPRPILKLATSAGQKVVGLNSNGKARARLHLSNLSGVQNDASGQANRETSEPV